MLEIIKSGGPLMVPLIGCAVLSLALISLERVVVFRRLPDRDEDNHPPRKRRAGAGGNRPYRQR